MNPLLAKAIAEFPSVSSRIFHPDEIHTALAKLFEETVRAAAKTVCAECRNDVPMISPYWHVKYKAGLDYSVPCDATHILNLLEP